MLESDIRRIGERLYALRKKTGLTQAEAAEAAGVSDRTYADIERGTTTMRIDTLTKICDALHITPDELMVTDECAVNGKQQRLFERLAMCDGRRRETALRLLEVFLDYDS